MKKILFILLACISLSAVGQKYTEISKSQVTGSDTTLYLVNGKHNLLTIDFTQTNANTSTLYVGHSDDRVNFTTATVTGITWPLTLSKVTYTNPANGYTRSRVAFSSDNWPGTYIAVKITFADVTVGTYKITY